MVNYYPAFINLSGKQCVVVGGGKVSERKVF
ncbi:MAG TPA: siroheme synthase, partial [Nitrospiraceae bacterium]|nr:siroheme synthase [Nitrospiraceae bacterium]